MERKLKKQNNEIAELNKQNASLLGENNDLADENKNLKKAKSPRGKSESSKLVEKEAEIAKLKEALILLRQEMTSLIEERLRENAAPVEANEANSEKRARETENLRSKVAKLQKERDEIAKEVKLRLESIFSFIGYLAVSPLQSIICYSFVDKITQFKQSPTPENSASSSARYETEPKTNVRDRNSEETTDNPARKV